MSAPYAFLDDAAERAFLTEVAPAEVLANAHRAYDWLLDNGLDQDSFLRELAFTKAADALGIDYDVLYDAWLNQTPVTA